MATDAMKSGNILTNPRQSTVEDIEALYIKGFIETLNGIDNNCHYLFRAFT